MVLSLAVVLAYYSLGMEETLAGAASEIIVPTRQLEEKAKIREYVRVSECRFCNVESPKVNYRMLRSESVGMMNCWSN